MVAIMLVNTSIDSQCVCACVCVYGENLNIFTLLITFMYIVIVNYALHY